MTAVALTPDWTGVDPPAFERVFSNALRIQISSMFAFLTSQVVDISVFFLLKKATGNRMLWLRATGSTAVSQAIDTAIITGLVFGGQMTFGQYTHAVTSSYIVKLMAAIAVTPLIYGLHELLERRFKLAPVPVEVGQVVLLDAIATTLAAILEELKTQTARRPAGLGPQ